MSGRTPPRLATLARALQWWRAVPARSPSNRRRAPLSRSEAEGLLDRQHEDLAIADLTRASRVLDRLGDDRRPLVRHQDLDLHLGQELHHVLRAPVELGVPLLAPEPLHLGDGHALDTLLG